MEKQNEAKKAKKASVKVMILVPVLILGIGAIVSNIFGLVEIKKVNRYATVVTDECMVKMEELDGIERNVQNIHNMALSHIIAADFDTMIQIVGEIEEEEKKLDQNLREYEKNIDAKDQDTAAQYQGLMESYQSLRASVMNVLAFSANQDTAAAYACANGALSEDSAKMQSYIQTMTETIAAETESGRAELAQVYHTAIVLNMGLIAGCVFVMLTAIVVVLQYVIRPVMLASKEISQIISDIDNREGDLTKRITIKTDDEIAALSKGINTFMEKLQDIFGVIISNSDKMETVVSEVLNSVQTSNESASDLSAVTEELAATMQEVSNSASAINHNAEAVSSEVNHIAEKSNEINEYSKNMKQHADHMEQTARNNMQETNKKMTEILSVLNQAIEDSKSVDQVNSLTNDILNISSQTNLLALNASIEAARAGEAGKGFAVVATEISQLADSSRDAANHIQEINSIVTQAVHNLAEHANNLVEYMKESILPEFEEFVEEGGQYKENATYVESVMNDFSDKTSELKNVVSEIASSIQSITSAIEEGVKGVTGAAESTQTLVYDMDNIASRMDENQKIVGDLQKETAIFTKL